MRFRGINIPEDKQIQYALTALYGIGLSTAQSILEKLDIDPVKKTKDVTDTEEAKLREVIDGMTLEGDLSRSVMQNIKRLKDIGCYRGNRHKHNLPVKGQRTKTNSRTVRGNKRSTMGSGKVKVSKT